MKLFIGNLSYSTTQDTLEAEFGAYGQVEEVVVVTDRETGRPRGFAFVKMPNREEAERAVESLNGVELDGRAIVVDEAKPSARTGGPGGGGGRQGGGGGWRD